MPPNLDFCTQLLRIFIHMNRHLIIFLSLLASVSVCNPSFGKADKFRCMWRESPATTMVIGWNQVSGINPIICFGPIDYGQDASKYPSVKKADRVVAFHEMSNHFVRLTGLKPNTNYFFIIKDSEGVSKRYYFRTTPDDPTSRLSIAAGGDSRNMREACRKANLMVAKLKPHFVLFGGDMTDSDSPMQWIQWMDDWQYTIADDGRMTPIVVARGNHEYSNQSLIDLFDVASSNLYYKLTFCGDLLSVITLNSLIATGGDQKDWLASALAGDQDKTWRIVQYHFPIRPHTSAKLERNDQAVNWSTLFQKYNVNLAIESDAHLAKITHPIKPFLGPGNDEGYIQDASGTTYIGEGGWGAPLRQNNDDKDWTMASGSFNHFNWLWVDQMGIQIRTVKTDAAEKVEELNANNPFAIPKGIDLWNMGENGTTVTLPRKDFNNNGLFASRGSETESAPSIEVLRPDGTGKIRFSYTLDAKSDLQLALIDGKDKAIQSTTVPAQAPGRYDRQIETRNVPPGKYILILKANGKLMKKFIVMK